MDSLITFAEMTLVDSCDFNIQRTISTTVLEADSIFKCINLIEDFIQMRIKQMAAKLLCVPHTTTHTTA